MEVALVDKMGSDLTVVNAARVSFGKNKEVFEASDEKLISFSLSQVPFRFEYSKKIVLLSPHEATTKINDDIKILNLFDIIIKPYW